MDEGLTVNQVCESIVVVQFYLLPPYLILPCSIQDINLVVYKIRSLTIEYLEYYIFYKRKV